MSPDPHSRHLHVLRPPDTGGQGWADLVAFVAELTGLDPKEEALPRAGTADPSDVLAVAVASDDPVLVLPPKARMARAEGQPRVVLVPSDRSRSERRVLRGWIERIERRGVEVRQMHVMTRESHPVMWEGPGHHAEAWWNEIAQRHRAGVSTFSVRTGDPTQAILAESAACDLVVLFWRGGTSPDRARVLRDVIAGATCPLLVVQRAPLGSHDVEWPEPWGTPLHHGDLRP